MLILCRSITYILHVSPNIKSTKACELTCNICFKIIKTHTLLFKHNYNIFVGKLKARYKTNFNKKETKTYDSDI